jgi:hypothetical protein
VLCSFFCWRRVWGRRALRPAPSRHHSALMNNILFIGLLVSGRFSTTAGSCAWHGRNRSAHMDVSSNMKHVSTYCTFLALSRLLLRCLSHWRLSNACCYKIVQLGDHELASGD